jgi:hypothetical protein
MARNTAWLLVNIVIVLLWRGTGGQVTAIATAASSAIYGFYSVLVPRIIEYETGLPSTSVVVTDGPSESH